MWARALGVRMDVDAEGVDDRVPLRCAGLVGSRVLVSSDSQSPGGSWFTDRPGLGRRRKAGMIIALSVKRRLA